MTHTLILFLGLLGCEGQVEQELSELCQDAPVTTYDNFGQGFLLQNCQSCHASTSDKRYGAPEGVSFDSEELAWEYSERILSRTLGEAPDMPPQGGIDESERLRLQQWLECGG